MPISYRRPGDEAVTGSAVAAAIAKVPTHVRDQLSGPGKQSVDLLCEYLPPAESIDWIASATIGYQATGFHCLLALTPRRLLFVAPAPQVISWRLPTITRVQALPGVASQMVTFFVDDSGDGKYQLGADGEWGGEFVPKVKLAIARAILQDR